jgi:hypothetical protein
MQLDSYYHSEGSHVRFTRQQASDFAKGVAGDFNPIHDVDAKRFCVPGDLLFSVALERYGLSQRMRVVFAGMVGDGAILEFPRSTAPSVQVRDGHGKVCLSMERSGPRTTDRDLIRALTRCYVQFSGQAFPQILVPLMARHERMINPDRPLIVYESMSIELDRLGFGSTRLELSDAHLDIEGKRGDAHLEFAVLSGNEVIGRGAKTMVLSGLRPFAAERIDALVNDYLARKSSFAAGA